MPVDLIGYLYAATVAAGGVMGYVKASSIPSLAAGLTFGGLLGVGAYMTSQNPPRPLMQLGTAVVLAGVMGARFSKSGKLMPAGIICIISCAAIIRNIMLHHNQFPMLGGR